MRLCVWSWRSLLRLRSNLCEAVGINEGRAYIIFNVNPPLIYNFVFLLIMLDEGPVRIILSEAIPVKISLNSFLLICEFALLLVAVLMFVVWKLI